MATILIFLPLLVGLLVTLAVIYIGCWYEAEVRMGVIDPDDDELPDKRDTRIVYIAAGFAVLALLAALALGVMFH